MSKTAEQKFLDQYRDFEQNGAGASPEWVKKLRSKAISRFEENGFPTTRDEAWRFTSVKQLLQSDYSLGSGDDSSIEGLGPQFLEEDGFRVVLVGGRFSVEQSRLEGLPKGVTITSMSDAVEDPNGLAAEFLASQGTGEETPFSALNTAFLRDGVFVHVAQGVELPKPVEILFSSVEEGMVEHPRVLIIAEANSRLQVIENYIGDEGVKYLRNCVTEVQVRDGASVELCRVQRESKAAFHTATTNVTQERSSTFKATLVVLGSHLSRHDVNYLLDGEGAEGHLNGLYLLNGEQHVDHYTLIDHAKPNCESNEFLNGVLDEKSHAVFTGRILVREDAQKTDSKQSNNNMLLSESARIDTQPQLDIFADDVRCTHGATLGPIDADSVLYLRTRGIGEDDARRMLTYGFGVEILDKINMGGVRATLGDMVREQLVVEG
jgi:Fe-S cluster assembly protein SufD